MKRRRGGKDVVPELERRLAELQRSLGPAHEDTLAAMNELAAALLERGEPDRARKLQEASLAIHRHVHGADHPSSLELASRLAATCFAEGDLERARSRRSTSSGAAASGSA